MKTNEVLMAGVEALNATLIEALEGMTPEQLNAHPGGNANTAGFNAWHAWRTQDNVANFVLQGKPTVWMADGYVERTGLPKAAQGTGFSKDDALGVRIEGAELLQEYGKKVGATCVELLGSVDDAWLAEVTEVKPLGEMERWRAFQQVIITHGHQHLGEVRLWRGMQGLEVPS